MTAGSGWGGGYGSGNSGMAGGAMRNNMGGMSTRTAPYPAVARGGGVGMRGRGRGGGNFF
jgi:hypothetical protein